MRLHEPPASEKAAQPGSSQQMAAQRLTESQGVLSRSWPGKSLLGYARYEHARLRSSSLPPSLPLRHVPASQLPDEHATDEAHDAPSTPRRSVMTPESIPARGTPPRSSAARRFR